MFKGALTPAKTHTVHLLAAIRNGGTCAPNAFYEPIQTEIAPSSSRALRLSQVRRLEGRIRVRGPLNLPSHLHSSEFCVLASFSSVR